MAALPCLQGLERSAESEKRCRGPACADAPEKRCLQQDNKAAEMAERGGKCVLPVAGKAGSEKRAGILYPKNGKGVAGTAKGTDQRRRCFQTDGSRGSAYRRPVALYAEWNGNQKIL